MTGAFVAEGGAAAPATWTRSVHALLAVPVLVYAALVAVEVAGGVDLPEFAKVGFPFLVLPLAWVWWRGEPQGLGRIDRAFVLSVLVYAPFSLWAVLATRGSPAYLEALAASVATPASALAWGAMTFVHVGAVDHFTKRVVQHEATARWGMAAGFWLGLAAWLVGHVLEWTWLRGVDGNVGAAAFILATGVATGLAYARWRNVWGLMVGHLLVNVCLAVDAAGLAG